MNCNTSALGPLHPAEVEDAFTVPDWGCSTCPACGYTHRETFFAFPPPPLLNAFVAKARADGARAMVVTPLSVAAPFWNKLLRASIVPIAEGYLRVRRQVTGKLAIFAVDFTPYSTRSRASPYSPPCGREDVIPAKLQTAGLALRA